MRTIKFRGKSMLDEQWVTGDLVHAVYDQKQKEVYCIADGEYKKEELDDDSEDGCDWGYKLGKDIFPVYKETIGQYTGVNDKNGKEIYEGDIIRLLGVNNYVSEVFWEKEISAFCIRYLYEMYIETKPLGEWIAKGKIEVIGDVHDTPQLLNTESKWRSVKEELPKAGEYVLISLENRIEASVWDEYYQSWDDANGNYKKYDKDCVDFWLRIPEPPKTETK